MTDLSSLTADQLAEKVRDDLCGLPGCEAVAHLAELQTRANLHDEKIREGWQAHADVEAELEAAEQERDKALARELESRHERGCGIYNANPPWTCSCGLEAAEARLAETQQALRQIADGEVRQVNAARHARAALATHPEAKP